MPSGPVFLHKELQKAACECDEWGPWPQAWPGWREALRNRSKSAADEFASPQGWTGAAPDSLTGLKEV